MMRMGAITAGALVLAVVVLLALFWLAQERMVFQPPAAALRTADDALRLDYIAADGQQLYGLIVGDVGAATGLLIAFHGNADLAARMVPWARELASRTGWAVLLAEYRGYGGLDGRPTAAGVRLDARAAWNAATDSLGVDPGTIALYGHSLGTGIAVQLAADVAAERRDPAVHGDARGVSGGARPPVHALLLESPFLSARAMAGRVGPPGTILYRAGLVRFQWNTEAHVRELAVPVAVAHGAQDAVVPVDMGRRVHAAAAVPGPLLIVEGAGHNDIAWRAGEDYWRWVTRALDADAPAGTAGNTETEGA